MSINKVNVTKFLFGYKPNFITEGLSLITVLTHNQIQIYSNNLLVEPTFSS